MPDVLETLKKLPKDCYARHPSDHTLIMIKRGVSGYFGSDRMKVVTDEEVDAMNKKHGTTKEQRLAMECGSAFGWEVPGADPDCWIGKT